MKVISINYQPIAKGRCANALIQKIFDSFLSLSNTNSLFLTSNIDNDYGQNIEGLHWSCHLLIRIFRKFCKLFHKPYYYQRTIEEAIVDRYMSIRLKRINEPYTLLTSMYSPISCSIAKNRGSKVIFVAGNLNDNMYYDAVKLEKKRLGLDYTDVYDSDFRLSYYNRTLTNVDEIWCNSKLCVRSFAQLHKTKLVPTMFYTFNESNKIKNIKSSNNTTFGYIGHTVLLKGIHQFAEAISKSEHKDNILLEIAGSIAPEIKEIIDKFHINVKYLGRITDEEKKQFMLCVDALVVSSLFDCGPTTIYEGLEVAVPLIVSDGCGGAEFLTDDVNCVLFEHSNIDDLAKKIDYFCDNKDKIRRSSIETNSLTINTIVQNHPSDSLYRAINELLN